VLHGYPSVDPTRGVSAEVAWRRNTRQSIWVMSGTDLRNDRPRCVAGEAAGTHKQPRASMTAAAAVIQKEA
jgi:hypothetical protein